MRKWHKSQKWTKWPSVNDYLKCNSDTALWELLDGMVAEGE